MISEIIDKIIYCNSDCEYSSKSGICIKKDDILMLWARPKKSKQFYPKVFCDNYISKKKEKKQ